MSEEKERSIEELFERIDAVIGEMEDDSVSLEDSFKLYEEGMSLLKESNERIDLVEKKVLALSEDGETYEFEGEANES